MSNLTQEQLAKVEQWAAEGATLNDVQSRLKAEFGISLTYLEARLLMLDIGVRLKDKPREQSAKPEPAPPQQPQTNQEEAEDIDLPAAAETEPAVGREVTLTADQIAIPGALISGKVTFSDGQSAAWYLDQFGRLGLSGAPQGYQPPKGDIPKFQQQLDMLMQRAGF
ncbi:MAG: hypothetical protein LDL31_04650 [Prosthecobacter sp.]|nr:hypothetical protein [Prosthecobacter sp.]